jgi:hypothetical protein
VLYSGREANVLTRWDHALRFLPENDLIPLVQARALILAERAQLWCGEDCAGVTEVSGDGRLHIMLAGGSMAGLLAMRPDVEAFARRLGCRAVYLSGRKGWRRIFPRFGYAFDGEDMVKALS